MNIGFGSLKQMNDTLKYNRDILPKRKKIKDLYREEIKKRTNTEGHYDLAEVRARVKEHLRKSYRSQRAIRISGIIIVTTLVVVVVWIFSVFPFTTKRKPINRKNQFGSIVYAQDDPGIKLKVDFFVSGPIAAKTYYKDSLRHLNSYSYYESGELFRSAFYYNDTLLTEFYFLKSGDTIRHFPAEDKLNIQHIVVPDRRHDRIVEFDYWDGKILAGTYRETRPKEGASRQ